MGISPLVKPVRSDDVLYFPAKGRYCLHHLGNDRYFILNEAGMSVWQRCDGILTVEQIADQISAQFEAEPTTVLIDALDLIEELSRRDCLVLLQPGASLGWDLPSPS
jgi:hypothetical protein